MMEHETSSATLLDPKDALHLVSGFLPREWAHTDIERITVRHIKGGMVNTMQLVQRSTPAILEPAAVIIRHFGVSGEVEEPRASNLSLSAAQQAVVCIEVGRRGWGPRVYGVFQGGRLEEYLESHTLSPAEASDPTIRRDVARCYARLHSLDLPLRRDGFDLIVREFIESAGQKHSDIVNKLHGIHDEAADQYATIFRETDWAGELEWVAGLFQKYHCQVSVTHGDANYLNVLVKNSWTDCRVALIDFETVSYNYRGFDLGGHFNERMYCYAQPDTQLTGYSILSLEERRSFCESYLQEKLSLGQELSEYDTVDHLILEAQIGRMFTILFVNLMCTVFDEVEIEPVFLSALAHMMGVYRQLKLDFISID